VTNTAPIARATAADLAAEIVRKFGRLRLKVEGMSMVPAVLPADIVVIERARPREVTAGDLVVFARDGRLVLHRVLKQVQHAYGFQLITQGDRVGQPDAPVSAQELLGRVSSIERRGQALLPPRRLGLGQRVTSRVLRLSSRATGAFLAGQRFFSSGRTAGSGLWPSGSGSESALPRDASRKSRRIWGHVCALFWLVFAAFTPLFLASSGRK
jgi:signal peptidase I